MIEPCFCGVEFEIETPDGIEFEIGDEQAEGEMELDAENTVIVSELTPVYHGETVVEPRFFSETILPTHGKLVETDIMVNEIRIEKVSSPTGGYVYYIGT